MIVTNNKTSINGNNALAPQKISYKPSKDNELRELEKQKREHIKINREKAIEKKIKILRNIIFSFAIGILVIYRYSVIYNIEKDIVDVKTQISAVNAENENLKIDLLKYNNIKELESKAVNELNMVPKSLSSVIYIDLEKNNFENTSDSNNLKSNGIINKIKKILY